VRNFLFVFMLVGVVFYIGICFLESEWVNPINIITGWSDIGLSIRVELLFFVLPLWSLSSYGLAEAIWMNAGR